VDRFLELQRTVFQRETSFFHHYKDLQPYEARDVALGIWQRINLPNLVDNIEPTRRRARVVMRKGGAPSDRGSLAAPELIRSDEWLGSVPAVAHFRQAVL
jgi:hypothetical protein